MRVRIQHGAHEVGGNSIEVAADNGQRVVLDIGRPLAPGPDDVVPLPGAHGVAPQFDTRAKRWASWLPTFVPT